MAIVATRIHGAGRSCRRRVRGFSLVEIAIVLVIIGLLIGSVLKGQEMISSARVRDLADTASEVQTAYFGFVDRFQQVPGDWSAINASAGIGATIAGGGNADGALDHTLGIWIEPNAMWEQLSAAGFVKGEFDGGTEEPTNANDNGAFNSYNGLTTVARSPDFVNSTAPRRHVLLGRRVPAKVYAELDVKLDDGNPGRGDVRATLQTPTVLVDTLSWGGSDANCVTAPAPPAIATWDAASGTQDCNAVVLF